MKSDNISKCDRNYLLCNYKFQAIIIFRYSLNKIWLRNYGAEVKQTLIGYCLSKYRAKNKDQWRVVSKAMNMQNQLAEVIPCVRGSLLESGCWWSAINDYFVEAMQSKILFYNSHYVLQSSS